MRNHSSTTVTLTCAAMLALAAPATGADVPRDYSGIRGFNYVPVDAFSDIAFWRDYKPAGWYRRPYLRCYYASWGGRPWRDRPHLPKS